jgi:MraZ protein
MLLGEITYKMGQKHRLALPKKFRDAIGQSAIMTRGYEGCLVIVGQGQWQKLIADVQDGSFLDISARESARFLFGGASEIEMDTQGRFVVPSSLYDYAGLNNEVVFVGLGSWVEVWSQERWQQQLQQLADNGAAIAQRLVASGGSA